MFKSLLDIVKRCYRYFVPGKAVRQTPPPLPTAPPLPPVQQEPEPTATTTISANRHERRRLERARRKYDKFVEPNKGSLPEQPVKEKQPQAKRRKHIEVIVQNEGGKDAELLIADSHHENRADLVAYKESEIYGEFNFRDTILQQLERYFVYLDRMRRNDPESYGYYREVGAIILPYMANGSWYRQERKQERSTITTPLADHFNLTRPSFGCFAYGADPETERYEQTAKNEKSKRAELWVPKFMYFRKYKMPPPEIQMISGGDTYVMTVYWDRPFDKKMKHGMPQEFGIYVSADGKEVVALRVCDTRFVPVPSKRENKRREVYRRSDLGHISIPKRAWHIPGDFEKWARDNGESAQHLLTEIFKQSVRSLEHAQYSMARVTARKDDVAAIFNVNIHRTAYFFQDRDIELTTSGQRRRIFHFVRPHVRSDGSTVRAHFRGEREFTWAGYDVRISIPGRDHVLVDDIDFGAVDEYWAEPDDELVDMPEIGKTVRKKIDEDMAKGEKAK